MIYIKLFGIGALVFLGYLFGHYQTQVKWDKEKLESHAKYEKDLGDARDREFELGQTILKKEQEKNALGKKIHSDYALVIASLRNPPSPSIGQGTTATGDSMGPTGASLPANFQLLVAHTFERGDRLREQLQSCQAEYDKAREIVNQNK